MPIAKLQILATKISVESALTANAEYMSAAAELNINTSPAYLFVMR